MSSQTLDFSALENRLKKPSSGLDFSQLESKVEMPTAVSARVTSGDREISRISAAPAGMAPLPSVGDEAAIAAESNAPSAQFKEWLAGLAGDLGQVFESGHDQARRGQAIMGLIEKLTRPAMNVARRTVDPLGGGSVANLERGRPMGNDPEAAAYIDMLAQTLGGIAATPMLAALKAKLPASVIEAFAAVPETETAAVATTTPAAVTRPGKITYREAQQTVRDMPVRRLEAAEGARQQRDIFSSERQAGIQAAEREAEEALRREVKPMQSEQQQLQLARRRTQENLSRTQTQQAVANVTQRQALKAERSQAEKAAEQATERRAGEYVAATGEAPEKIPFAMKSEEARIKEFDTVQRQVRDTHKGILAIAERPGNVTIQTKEVPTGLIDAAGNAITKAKQTSMPGMIEMSDVKAALARDYDTIAGEIQIAVQNGSPGARALQQVVNGPDSYTLEQALNIKAALNDIGYGRADAAMTTMSEAIARKTAASLRESIRRQVAGFKDGGKEAVSLMDKEADILKARDARFKTPAARAAARSMERYGDAARLKDPVAVKSWLAQVDAETAAGARAQVAHNLLGESPKEFAKNWKAMDPELKAQWFTPEQISKGDEIASGSQEAIRRITEEYQAKETARITRAVENSAVIRRKRADLTQLQTNIDELRRKASDATGAIKVDLEKRRAAVEADFKFKQAGLRQSLLETRKRLIRQQQAAQARIDKVAKYRRLAWIAGAAAVGSWASSKYRAIHEALFGGF